MVYKNNKTSEIKIPVHQGLTYDVIVIGGGPSGVMAGLASARSGAKTLIVEQHGFLGGSLTAMGVGPMMSFHNNIGEQVVRGFPQELIERLMNQGASPGHIEDSTTYCTTVTPFDSEYLKLEMENMLRESDADILYHTKLACVQTDQRGTISNIILCNKAGLSSFSANVFVDASGDGDLAVQSGVEFRSGRESDGATQPMTMNLKLCNVNTEKIRQYAIENPDDFEFAHGVEEGIKRLKKTPRISLGGFKKAWQEAKDKNDIDIPREHVLFFETATPGVVIVNTSRIQGMDATDPFQLSEAEMIGRKQCMQLFHFLRQKCPGFENAIRMDSSSQIGVRESRHVKGLYTLTAENLANQKKFPDTIALGGYPVDIHSPEKAQTDSVHFAQGTTYRIPMRSLLVEKPENLVIAGRCISATHEAMAAFRVTPIAMAIGQAAGTIASLSAKQQSTPPSIDYQKVRNKLLDDGALLI